MTRQFQQWFQHGSFADLLSGGFLMSFAQAIRIMLSYLLVAVIYFYGEPRDVALYSNFVILVSIVTPVFVLKPEVIVSKSYFDLEDDEFMGYVSSAMTYIALSALLSAAALMIASELVEDKLGITRGFTALVSVYVFGYGVLFVSSTVVQMKGRRLLFPVLRNSDAIGRFVIGVAAILILPVTWAGAVYGVVFGMLAAAAVAFAAMLTTVSFRFLPSVSQIRDYFFLGIGTVPMTLAFTFGQTMDRIIVTDVYGLDLAGIYAFGAIFASSIWILGNAIQQIWNPWLFKRLKHPEKAVKQEIFQAFATISLVLLLACAVLIGGMHLAVNHVLRPEYAILTEFFFIVTIGYTISSLRLFFDGIFYFAGAMWTISSILLLGAVGGYLLCMHWTVQYGLTGTALAIAITNLAVYITTGVIAWIKFRRIMMTGKEEALA